MIDWWSPSVMLSPMAMSRTGPSLGLSHRGPTSCHGRAVAETLVLEVAATVISATLSQAGCSRVALCCCRALPAVEGAASLNWMVVVVTMSVVHSTLTSSPSCVNVNGPMAGVSHLAVVTES